MNIYPTYTQGYMYYLTNFFQSYPLTTPARHNVNASNEIGSDCAQTRHHSAPVWTNIIGVRTQVGWTKYIWKNIIIVWTYHSGTTVFHITSDERNPRFCYYDVIWWWWRHSVGAELLADHNLSRRGRHFQVQGLAGFTSFFYKTPEFRKSYIQDLYYYCTYILLITR